tara:strand:+ start:512 stop:784 length:273 start_codon:yes stop_codon:yes gene_type:complete
MEHISSFEKRFGVDIGFGNFVGQLLKFEKTSTLQEVMEAAHEIKANVIIKAGKNAKWYVKSCPEDRIQSEINKQTWRDTHRATMWIIKWD